MDNSNKKNFFFYKLINIFKFFVFILIFFFITINLFAANLKDFLPGFKIDDKRHPAPHDFAVKLVIGTLNYSNFSNVYRCTAVLVGDKYVLTSAHCLIDPFTKKTYVPEYLHFLAGFYMEEYAASSKGIEILISPDYNPSDENNIYNAANDWGLLVLEKPLGEDLGFMKLSEVNVSRFLSSLKGKPIFFQVGYSQDFPYIPTINEPCGRVEYTTNPEAIIHDCYVLKGDSGSPIYYMDNGKPVLIAIHSATLTSIKNESEWKMGLAIPADKIIKGLYKLKMWPLK